MSSADNRIAWVGPTRFQRDYLERLAGEPFDPAKPCEDCGAPMGEHIIGGPGSFHPRPFKPATYDPACFDLAKYFLQDEPPQVRCLTHRMATELQQWIEDWIAYERGAESASEHDVSGGAK